MIPDLEVLDVGEGDANGDHRPGVVVREVQAFADLAPAHGDEQGPVCSTTTEQAVAGSAYSDADPLGQSYFISPRMKIILDTSWNTIFRRKIISMMKCYTSRLSR